MSESVVIAGGGLAGATAACVLARAGRQVLVLERETGPVDKICGEFLSIEAQDILTGLGLDLMALGAQPIDKVRLVHGRAVVEAPLPFPALGLSRKTLDEALLRQASASGAQIARGTAISEVCDGATITLRRPYMPDIETRTLFLATGKHDVRGERRRVTKTPEDLVGFKAYFRLAPQEHSALQGYVEVMMSSDGYAGLQLVDGGRANLCLLVQRDRLSRAGGSWSKLLAGLCSDQPHLARRLAGAESLSEKPLTIFRVPYGFIHKPVPTDSPGLYRLGDQMGVIPSFTGDGMSIALYSAQFAATCYLAGVSGDAYHAQMRRLIIPQIAWATIMYRLMSSALGQGLIMMLARCWPGVLGLAATLTRLTPAVQRPGIMPDGESRNLIRQSAPIRDNFTLKENTHHEHV